jgi:hypothetical protein
MTFSIMTFTIMTFSTITFSTMALAPKIDVKVKIEAQVKTY